MKKTAIAAALGGLLSLPVYGGGIYVGDVKFFAKEVCSREYTSTFSFNSGCLPPTRVANAQNYFFEDMRLPISHDEAKRLDQVVQGVFAKHAELVTIAESTTNLSVLIKAIQEGKASLSSFDMKDIIAVLDRAKQEVDKLADETTKSKAIRLLGIKLADQVLEDGRAIFGSDAKMGTDLDSPKSALEEVAKLHSDLALSVNQLTDAISSADAPVSWNEKYKAVIIALAPLANDTKMNRATAELGKIKPFEPKEKQTAIDKSTQALFNQVVAIRQVADQLTGKEQTEIAPKLIAAADALADFLATCQKKLSPVYQLNTTVKNTMDVLSNNQPIVVSQATVVNTMMANNIPDSTKPITAMQLRVAVDTAAYLLKDKPSGSAIHDNLLTSLIGRVFVTDKKVPDSTKPNHVRYAVPLHGGNFQFLPMANKPQVKKINTEVLVNSDLSGVIRKNMGASGSVDLDQMVGLALKAAGIPAPKINSKLTAQLSAALSQTSLGTGSYYYVAMTDEALDELTGTALAWYISPQPADRDETNQTNDPSDFPKSTQVPIALAEALGIAKTIQIPPEKGLGIITGVAILRTRSGQTEVCSSMEIGLHKKGTSPSDIGSDKTSCAALRNILAEHDIAHADISPVLASLNAGYRQESYKFLKLGDHASVLAIQWIPLSLTKTVTTP